MNIAQEVFIDHEPSTITYEVGCHHPHWIHHPPPHVLGARSWFKLGPDVSWCRARACSPHTWTDSWGREVPIYNIFHICFSSQLFLVSGSQRPAQRRDEEGRQSFKSRRLGRTVESGTHAGLIITLWLSHFDILTFESVNHAGGFNALMISFWHFDIWKWCLCRWIWLFDYLILTFWHLKVVLVQVWS